jgi:hypothetical protein
MRSKGGLPRHVNGIIIRGLRRRAFELYTLCSYLLAKAKLGAIGDPSTWP